MSHSGQSNRRIVACVVLEAPAPRKPAKTRTMTFDTYEDMIASGYVVLWWWYERSGTK